MGRREVERGFQVTSPPPATPGHGASRGRGRATCLLLWLPLPVLSGRRLRLPLRSSHHRFFTASHPLFSRKCLSPLRGVSHFCLSLHPFPLITVQFSSALGISSSPFPVLGVSTSSRLCASLHPSILPLSPHWCVRASRSSRRLPALALQRCPEQPPPPPGPARPP